MSWMELLEWRNVIFLGPLLLSVFFLLVVFGGGSDSGHDANADADAGDAALPHAHGEAGGHGHDHDAGHEPSSLGQLLAAFGVGRVPLSLLLFTGSFLWGGTGFISNQVFGMVGVSIALATVAVLACTPFLARLFARVSPSYESYSEEGAAFRGATGKVLYPVTPDGGVVRVYDRYHNLRDLNALPAGGEGMIPVDARVVIVEYDWDRSTYLVTPYLEGDLK